VEQIKELARYTGIQRAVNQDIKPGEAMRIYRAGDDDEKRKMWPIIARKLRNSKGVSDEDKRAYAAELLADKARLKPTLK
jgi:hypothetical protein